MGNVCCGGDQTSEQDSGTYRPPKNKTKAFSGQGHQLSGNQSSPVPAGDSRQQALAAAEARQKASQPKKKKAGVSVGSDLRNPKTDTNLMRWS